MAQHKNTTKRNKILAQISKYIEVFNISAKLISAYPANFIADQFLFVLRITIFGIVYGYVFAHNASSINGITAVEAIWALGLVQLMYRVLKPGLIYRRFSQELISGQIAVRINKPYSFLLYNFFEAIGQVPVRTVITSGLMIFTLAIFFGIPHFTVMQLLGLPFLFLNGIFLEVLIQQMTGLTAFWIEKTDPVYWLVNKLAFIFNGTFVPIGILPKVFRVISDAFPLSAPFFIARIFEMKSGYTVLHYIMIQILWIVIIALFVKFWYNRGIKKISINGG